MIERTWELTAPFNLRQTLRFVLPKANVSANLGNVTSSYALGTEEGPATVTVSADQGSVTAAAIGPGAQGALADVPRFLGLDDNPTAFRTVGGPMRDLHRRYRGLRLGSTGRVFDTILPLVIGQRVTTDEAKASFRRLCRAIGDPAPGDLGLVLPPRSGALAHMSYEDLHVFGIERSRAHVVIEVARRASRLEETLAMDGPQARKRLNAVRGLGPWTIEQVMGVAWGDRDAIPLGDFHLPNTVSWLLAGEPRGTDQRMEELLDPYRPYRRRAMILIKLSGVTAPRYGPKSSKSVISRD